VTTDLEQLADKADDLARKFREPATFELVRAALNEAGVTAARRRVDDALTTIAVAQEQKWAADQAERAAKDALDGAELDADWALTPPDVNEAGAKLLADDKKAWKKREARRDPAIVAATERLRQAEHATAVARDGVVLADKRFKACCADLEAAIATLNALCMALPARKAASA
jgi:hypothetical protein